MINSDKIFIRHTLGSLRKSSGGPSRTVTSLCEALGRANAIVELVSRDNDESDNDALIIPSADWVKTTLVPPNVEAFREALKKPFPQLGSSVMHDNGIWMPTNHAAVSVARELSVPLIISTRGMLEPWALQHRAWKKRLAWWLYQRRDLQSATVLHATAAHEVESLRRLGICHPIAMIPNGVDSLSSSNAGRGTSDFATQGSSETRTALFLSRIHPVKGLLQLVDAWSQVQPAGWRLSIAGPDEDGHQKEVEARIRKYGLDEVIRFVGAVEGARKDALYQLADLFVLPTFSENFGLVVAEALARGVPVLTTKGAPWESLVQHRCGWWVEPTLGGISQALSEATLLDSKELRAMGERGKVYAQQFNWDDIAKDMLAVYRWVLGQGDRPDCVVLD